MKFKKYWLIGATLAIFAALFIYFYMWLKTSSIRTSNLLNVPDDTSEIIGGQKVDSNSSITNGVKFNKDGTIDWLNSPDTNKKTIDWFN